MKPKTSNYLLRNWLHPQEVGRWVPGGQPSIQLSPGGGKGDRIFSLRGKIEVGVLAATHPLAALRGTRSLVYPQGMSWSLRSGRLALQLLATVFRGFNLKTLPFLLPLLALCFVHKVGAAELPYPEVVINDVKHVVTAPARWEVADWHKAGWASLAVLGTAIVIDRPWRDEMRRHSGNDPFIKQVERFGAEYAPLVLGGFYLAGIATDDETAVHVAQDGLAASIIASGLISPAIKLAVGRSRPRNNVGIAYLKPFSEPNASFPSGHTTEAFALAAVIADHYQEDWVDYTVYSIAGMVGLARTYHDAHFASDVLLGAMIGTLVGKSVVAHNTSLRSDKLVLLPDVSQGLIGIRMTGSF